MSQKIYSEIVDLYTEYINEILAEGAWCAHAYATEYLSDLRKRMTDLAKKIKKEYTGKRKEIEQTASHILFKLSTDYDELINKIYNKDFSEEDRYEIADALNDAFKKQMEEAFDDFSYIYEQLSGKKMKGD